MYAGSEGEAHRRCVVNEIRGRCVSVMRGVREDSSIEDRQFLPSIDSVVVKKGLVKVE